MRITRLESLLLRLPLDRPVRKPPPGRPDHFAALFVHLETDAGFRGLGFTYARAGGARALQAVTEDDLAPLVVGEDALAHERIGARVQRRLRDIGFRGLVARAYAAVDLALWDIKGKAAGMPLCRLLGGARDAAPVYVGDTGWPWMSAEEVVEATLPALGRGMMGLLVRVGAGGPEADADRLTRIREALGEDIWLGVDAGGRYDYGTALSMGRFFQEEIGVDWFEEPVPAADVRGHRRLADKLDMPLAAGAGFLGRDEFRTYLAADAAAVLRPDVLRLGGLTAWLKVAALADAHGRPVAPHRLPEVGVHLACGLTNVAAVEYMPWLFPAFVEPPAVVNGQIVPPPRPGLGLELSPDVAAKYGVT